METVRPSEPHQLSLLKALREIATRDVRRPTTIDNGAPSTTHSLTHHSFLLTFKHTKGTMNATLALTRRESTAAVLLCGVVSVNLIGERMNAVKKETETSLGNLSPAPSSTATARLLLAHCEASSAPSLSHPVIVDTPVQLSWARRGLSSLGLISLPLPRVIQKNDPALTLSKRGQRQRTKDEDALRRIQQKMISHLQAGDKVAAGKLLQQSYTVLYGKNITPQDRQNFLQRYGCTGWTEQVLAALLQVGNRRGLVEIGAGHGQWARVLTDRYKSDSTTGKELTQTNSKRFDFVLAYDNMTELPLDVRIYNSRTQPHHDYFYNVQPCESVESVLQQWQCRGRVLLLVFPPPGDMAAKAVHAYTATSPLNDTVVYVGEGRGGANGDDAFFDLLQSGEWILSSVLPCKSFGDKGYESLYIMKRVIGGGGAEAASSQ